MRLIVIYGVILVIGEAIALGLGLALEQALPSWSMMIFIIVFLAIIWGAWLLAVKIDSRWTASAREPSARTAIQK
jgi:hypothetical protein